MSEDSSIPSSDKSWLERLTRVFTLHPRTNDELKEILREANENDLVDNEILSIMEGALGVGDTQVKEIMVPRPQMVVVKEEEQPEKFLKTIIESGHSRFPITGESIDDIKGILLAKNLLPLILNGTDNFDLGQTMLPANIIPETKRLNDLLKEFRENRYHMAIVVDEYGGVSGLVTIEDVLEEIVGEIEDETDLEENNSFIRKLNQRDYLVKALTPIEDFNEHFQCDLNDEEYDTIGGLLMKEFGHLPRRNEVATILGFRFRVINADNRKIHLLRMTAPEVSAGD
jgi:magnesium and cobalt transporter